MTIFGPKLDWRFAVCALCVGIGSLVATSVSQASCGDYVMIGGHGGHAGIAAHEGSEDNTRLAARVADYPRVPCSGPECSRRPAIPEKPPLTVISTALQHWGWSAPSIACERPRPAASVMGQHPCRELLHPGCVFRPPRPLA